MTRLVVIGDTHLQSTNPRNDDRLRTFDQVIEEGRALPDLGAWLHLGDVFHTRSTPEDRNAVAARFTDMAQIAPVVVIYGNHCSPLDLHVFGRLKARYPVIVIDQPTTLRVALATGGFARMFCLPYPSKAGLVAGGVTVGDVQASASAALDTIFMVGAEELARGRDAGDLPLMIGHATIANCVTSAGQPMGIHGEIVVTPTHLNRLGNVPKLFGHIHRPQDIYGATYVGSSARLDYAETEEKRYIVVEYASPTDWWQVSRPLVCPPRYHVEGALTREGFTWQVTKGPGGEADQAPANWRGCEVRVRYRFAASEKSVLRDAPIYAEFAEALRLQVEPIAVPDRALRAPKVAEAKTLAEKVAAYQQVDQLEPALLDKLATLEQLDSTLVLTNLQARLAAIEAGEKAMVAA